MNIDGSNPVKITDNQSEEWLPAWSPIGDQIVFQSDRDGNHEIYTMNTDGSNVQRLTDNSSYDGYPRWSHDGSKIVFESTRDGHYEIYKMDITGLNQVQLTFTNGNAFQPDWEPDKTSGLDLGNPDSEQLILFKLFQNYPNPFNPSTKIKYQIPELSFVSIEVYDVLGNEVATLVNEEKSIGSYELEFDGSELTSGIYIYQLKTDRYRKTKKMLYLK